MKKKIKELKSLARRNFHKIVNNNYFFFKEIVYCYNNDIYNCQEEFQSFQQFAQWVRTNTNESDI